MYIDKLTLFTHRIEAQVQFYSTILGLKCLEQSPEKVAFQIGNSVLTFLYRDDATPYHFALNIPSNKEVEALEWLKDRVTLLSNDGNELHDFDFWNAKAMYFYDPDQNIVEFISRKNLSNGRSEKFDQTQLLNISEIGMPTLDIESKFNMLNSLSGIPRFSGDLDRFLAFGDDHGLFICINKKIKDWFPTGDAAHSSDFELVFTEQGKQYHVRFKNDSISELSALG